MNRFRLHVLTWIFVATVVFTAACGGNKTAERQETPEDTSSAPPSVQELGIGQPTATPVPTPTAKPTGNTSDKATIGSYRTTLLDKDPDRVNNIEIAIEEINGYTLQSGETFSFNAVVGRRKAEKGYEKAKIIVNGKSKEGLGGGICQLSSTIYNAVRVAELEVVERHSHSKDVHYVPKGQDAAINYGTQDFKFRNNRSYPITLYVELSGGKIYASIQK